MRDILYRLREAISRIPADALDRECVPVTAAMVADAIKEIESLRSVAGAARAGGGPDVSAIKQAGGRSFSRK